MSDIETRVGENPPSRRAPRLRTSATCGAGDIVPGLPLDDFLPYLLNRIVNRFNLNLSEQLQEAGVTLQEYRVLAVLMAGDGRSVGELSVYTVTGQSTLSKLLERMVQVALVERRQENCDGRVVTIHITAKGRAAFRRILPLALDQFEIGFDGINDNERGQFRAVLHKILDNVRKSRLP